MPWKLTQNISKSYILEEKSTNKLQLDERVLFMDIEQKIKLHKELSKRIEELEEQKRILGSEIMKHMPSKILRIPGYVVRWCSRLSIKLSIEEARTFNAVRLEEVVDKDKIKALYNTGQSINGISEINYIQISEQSTV
jgi:hypothetical protein